MKMSELLIACNEDELEFQNLDKCAKSLEYNHKKGASITFGTTAVPGLDGHLTKKLGLVLWLDRDAVAAALARERSASA